MIESTVSVVGQHLAEAAGDLLGLRVMGSANMPPSQPRMKMPGWPSRSGAPPGKKSWSPSSTVARTSSIPVRPATISSASARQRR